LILFEPTHYVKQQISPSLKVLERMGAWGKEKSPQKSTYKTPTKNPLKP
jgi:hypothetical protein